MPSDERCMDGTRSAAADNNIRPSSLKKKTPTSLICLQEFIFSLLTNVCYLREQIFLGNFMGSLFQQQFNRGSQLPTPMNIVKNAVV